MQATNISNPASLYGHPGYPPPPLSWGSHPDCRKLAVCLCIGCS